MNTLKKQRTEDTFTIVDVLDEDNNLDRVTDRLFVKSDYEAFMCACENYRWLV